RGEGGTVSVCKEVCVMDCVCDEQQLIDLCLPVFQWETSYSGLALRRSCSLPEELHGRVEAALFTLRQRGCFLRDLVKVRDRDVFTAVSRVLLGQPGTTYRYLDTRLFTIPWHTDEQRGTCCDPDLSAACKALWELNCFFCSDVGDRKEGDVFKQCRKDTETETTDLGTQEKPVAELKHSLSGYHIEDEEDEDQQSGQGCSNLNPAKTPCPGPTQFNVTLLNYMDPAAMSQLKEEPYYGMGKMAVGWHHDENLVSLSPVAVYSYSCHDDDKGEGQRSYSIVVVYHCQ
ncbi:unnamed protein product, partial [Oncorhynchus mykiss]